MSDANDNIVVSGNAQVVSHNSIPNNDPLAINTSSGRINQQTLLPSSVQTRALGGLFSSQPEGTALGNGIALQLFIPANFSGNFIFYVSDVEGRQIVAVPDIAFYINTFDTSGQWPNGQFGMGNMPATVFNDWGLTDNFDVATRAVIRNNTGLDQTVICVCRHRIIANPGASTPQKLSVPLNEGSPGQGGGG